MRTLMKSPWLLFIMILFLSLGLADCGKKGPPVPPDDEPKQESPSPANP
jgi:predicted small lipoprotein YifL